MSLRARKNILLLLTVLAAFPFRIRFGIAGFNSFTFLDLAIFSSAAYLVAGWLRTGLLRIGDRRVFLVLALPPLLVLLSFLWSQEKIVTLRFLIAAMEALIAYLIVVSVAQGLSSRRLAACLAFLPVALIFGGVFMYLGVPGFPFPLGDLQPSDPMYRYELGAYLGRFGHPFVGVSNDFCCTMAVFPLVLFAYGTAAKKRWAIAAAAFTLLGMAATLSRGVNAAFIAGAALYLYLTRRDKPIPVVGIIASLTVIGLAIVGYNAITGSVQAKLIERFSGIGTDVRQVVLSHAFDKLQASPVLGYGGGVVPDHDDVLRITAHNTYVQSALYYGVPLALVLSLMLFTLPSRFWKWGRGDLAVRMVSAAVGCALLTELLAFTTEATFEASSSRVLLYFSLGLCIELLRSLERESRIRGDWTEAPQNLTA